MDFRISKLREYLYNVINTLTTNRGYQISVDFLGSVGDFSLDKIPTASTVEVWVTGTEIHRDVYSFRSRKYYSKDTINNLNNIGFFEQFEKVIKLNNKEGVLPEINGIESIECLNCATINSVDGTEATFDIQIQITYRETESDTIISL